MKASGATWKLTNFQEPGRNCGSSAPSVSSHSGLFTEGEGYYWALAEMGPSIISHVMLEYYQDKVAGTTSCCMSSCTAGSRRLASSSNLSCSQPGGTGRA